MERRFAKPRGFVHNDHSAVTPIPNGGALCGDLLRRCRVAVPLLQIGQTLHEGFDQPLLLVVPLTFLGQLFALLVELFVLVLHDLGQDTDEVHRGEGFAVLGGNQFGDIFGDEADVAVADRTDDAEHQHGGHRHQ